MWSKCCNVRVNKWKGLSVGFVEVTYMCTICTRTSFGIQFEIFSGTQYIFFSITSGAQNWLICGRGFVISGRFAI